MMVKRWYSDLIVADHAIACLWRETPRSPGTQAPPGGVPGIRRCVSPGFILLDKEEGETRLRLQANIRRMYNPRGSRSWGHLSPDDLRP